MPLSSAFYHNTLATGSYGRIQNGHFPWRLLPRLLLGLNVLVVCWRRYEPFMDSRNYAIRSVRKNAASW